MKPRSRLVLVPAVLLHACAARPVDPASSAPAVPTASTASTSPSAARAVPTAPPSATPAGAATSFGAPIDPTVEHVALADVVREPERYRDRTVRTEGKVARVCQRMGCWMELSVDGVEPVRVPMAGHAFFLPRDSAGRESEIQGVVRMTPLTAAMREHLESEGASALSATLSIEATGVRLN